jgi:NADP-dependent 3-hydroxy acid dehydrogenase YdfG
LREFYKTTIAIQAKSIANAIAYAIEQPADVEIDEIVSGPTPRISKVAMNMQIEPYLKEKKL